MRRGLDENQIRDRLSALCNGVSMPKIFFFDSCTSTNTEAKKYASSGGGDAIFIAASQTEGRGRRGRSFLSPEGGIYLSILRRDGGSDSARITAGAAVRSARIIEAKFGLRLGIKWVNDLYTKGKKVAGILTEGEFDESGKFRYYVVGMGINVYKNEAFCAEMPVATTLEDALKSEIDINGLCACLIYALALDNDGSESVIDEYRDRCVTVGQRVLVRSLLEEFEGEAVEVLDDFSLLVRLDSGECRRVFTGEVVRLEKA